MKRTFLLSFALASILAFTGACSRTAKQVSTSAAAPSNSPTTATDPQLKAPEPQGLTLPAGTVLSVRIPSAVSSNVNAPGSTVLGELNAPLEIAGKVVAPRGTTVNAVVADASKGGRIKGVAPIALRVTQLRLDHGKLLNVSTDAPQFWAPKSRKRDVIAVGVASGIGSAIGAVTGGGKGAAIGAGAGAGAGTAGVLATRGVPAVIPAESVITFRLRNPVLVPVS